MNPCILLVNRRGIDQQIIQNEGIIQHMCRIIETLQVVEDHKKFMATCRSSSRSEWGALPTITLLHAWPYRITASHSHNVEES